MPQIIGTTLGGQPIGASGRTLTPRSIEMLEMLNPMFQDDKDLQTAMLVVANEYDRIEAAFDEIINTFFPFLADTYLYLWEAMLGLGADPSLTILQRQQRILAFLTRRVALSSSSSWVQIVTLLLGSGWSFKRYPDGGTPRNTLTITLPFSTTSQQANDLKALLQVITPANTAIVIAGGQGFIIQQSGIQVQPL